MSAAAAQGLGGAPMSSVIPSNPLLLNQIHPGSAAAQGTSSAPTSAAAAHGTSSAPTPSVLPANPLLLNRIAGQGTSSAPVSSVLPSNPLLLSRIHPSAAAHGTSSTPTSAAERNELPQDIPQSIPQRHAQESDEEGHQEPASALGKRRRKRGNADAGEQGKEERKPKSKSRQGVTNGKALTATSSVSARRNFFTRADVAIPDAYKHADLWNPIPLSVSPFRAQFFMIMQLQNFVLGDRQNGRPGNKRQARGPHLPNHVLVVLPNPRHSVTPHTSVFSPAERFASLLERAAILLDEEEDQKGSPLRSGLCVARNREQVRAFVSTLAKCCLPHNSVNVPVPVHTVDEQTMAAPPAPPEAAADSPAASLLENSLGGRPGGRGIIATKRKGSASKARAVKQLATRVQMFNSIGESCVFAEHNAALDFGYSGLVVWSLAGLQPVPDVTCNKGSTVVVFVGDRTAAQVRESAGQLRTAVAVAGAAPTGTMGHTVSSAVPCGAGASLRFVRSIKDWKEYHTIDAATVLAEHKHRRRPV